MPKNMTSWLTLTPSEIWNRDILDAENYYELTDWHIKELTRLRFLPEEWPEDIKNMLFNMDGKQMLILSQLETDITVCQLKEALGLPCLRADGASSASQDDLNDFIQDWSRAKQKAEMLANQNGMSLIDFAEWNGEELAIDFYRLRNADELAFRDIEPSRLPQYKLLSEELYDMESDIHFAEGYSVSTPVGDVFKVRFGTLFYILDRFATGEASDNFLIDVEQGTLTDLKTVTDRESLQ